MIDVLITSSQTWTVPSYVTSLTLKRVGGGGGNQGKSPFNRGRAGTSAINIVSVVAGQQIPIVIGAAGAVGILSNGFVGGKGGDTTLLGLTVAGGSGGDSTHNYFDTPPRNQYFPEYGAGGLSGTPAQAGAVLISYSLTQQRPTVLEKITTDTTPIIRGTCFLRPDIDSLSVTVNGITYTTEVVVVGTDWSLQLPELALGTYGVIAKVFETLNTAVFLESIEIDSLQVVDVQQVPTVDFLETDDRSPVISGKAVLRDGLDGFKVKVGNTFYTDGIVFDEYRWTLQLPTMTIKNYSVKAIIYTLANEAIFKNNPLAINLRIVPLPTLFPFEMDWSKNLMEVFEWKTEILTSFNDTEQRSQTRKYPRVLYEFSIMVAREEAGYFSNLVWKNLANVWGLPMWHQKTRLQTSLAISSKIITLDDTTEFVDYLVFYTSPFVFEIKKIESKTATTLTLGTVTDKAYSKYTTIIPVHLARMEETAELKPLTGSLLTARCVFNCLPFIVPYTKLTNGEQIMYQSLPVHTEVTDWGQDMSSKLNIKITTFDNEVSAFLIDVEGKSPRVTKDFNWFLQGKTELLFFKSWLTTRAGRLKPFWFPSQTNDLVPISNTATTIIIKYCAYTNTVDNTKPVSKHIQIWFFNGTVVRKEVASSVIVDETEILTLVETISTTTSIKSISFLYLSRLDADRIEVNYQTPLFATSKTPMRSLAIDNI